MTAPFSVPASIGTSLFSFPSSFPLEQSAVESNVSISMPMVQLAPILTGPAISMTSSSAFISSGYFDNYGNERPYSDEYAGFENGQP